MNDVLVYRSRLLTKGGNPERPHLQIWHRAMKTRLPDLRWLGHCLDTRCLNLLGRHRHLAFDCEDCNDFRVASSCDCYAGSELLIVGRCRRFEYHSTLRAHCQLQLSSTVIYSSISTRILFSSRLVAQSSRINCGGVVDCGSHVHRQHCPPSCPSVVESLAPGDDARATSAYGLSLSSMLSCIVHRPLLV